MCIVEARVEEPDAAGVAEEDGIDDPQPLRRALTVWGAGEAEVEGWEVLSPASPGAGERRRTDGLADAEAGEDVVEDARGQGDQGVLRRRSGLRRPSTVPLGSWWHLTGESCPRIARRRVSRVWRGGAASAVAGNLARI